MMKGEKYIEPARNNCFLTLTMTLTFDQDGWETGSAHCHGVLNMLLQFDGIPING
jgi:hypothetical protein